MGEARSADGEGILGEQVAFYEADALHYEQWLKALSDTDNHSEVAVAARAYEDALTALFDSRTPLGDVLELAAGTGRISRLLAPHASRLTLVDASPTSLEVARRKLTGVADRLEVHCADIFAWEPSRRFNYVVFAAWLHHVPEELFDAFWHIVDEALAPGGTAAFDFADKGAPEATSAPPPEPSATYAAYHDPLRRVSMRDLDGRRWRVVYQTWSPAALGERLKALGWQLQPAGPRWGSFRWATAHRL